ncbi:ArsR/SmtB family transcription factor [Pelotomaculum propionicicum]|uniref:Transcriptional activator HlyU n=1 Tax=Pelotomaculum propionicicum TaxID=258475 RepID=A0A4Y7RPA2_9FIRM|nr:metalloregulator ArsR/SmtB family transcription factor [Pelotomaculum propionicicum]NLI13448.1 winged helix-turn-helix transcriptional regulator [Peptococcaceae bacterium]TEB10683.1 Transcriptional activator HlyU [Pelotomaculum propionicicum]
MDEIMVILKAMADETRLNILNLLLTHDFCVGALAKRINMSEAAISQHLQVLRRAGLVRGEKKGYFTHYWVDRDVIIKAAEEIKKIASQSMKCEGSCHKNLLDDAKYCRKKDDADV